MKIALLSSYNATNPDAMSGIPYHIGKALTAQCDQLDIISALDSNLTTFLVKSWRLIAKVPRFAGYDADSHPLVCKLRTLEASRLIGLNSYDLVVCVYAHTLTAYLEVNCPIVYVSDSTYGLNLKYYEYAKQQALKSQVNNNNLEQLAINNSSLLIYPSSWAAQSAISDYNADPSKVYEIPFGSNIDPGLCIDPGFVRQLNGTCRLLFIGRDWVRKGGSIAVKTLHLLQEAGIDAHLTICGCEPPNIGGASITVIPSLSRKNPDEVALLEKLFTESHFFFLPTRAEAFGIVFSEASAFALPSITTDTGGVCGAVKNGVNGYCLPLTASAEEYAALITQLWRNEKQYILLMKSTKAYYEDKLNWSAWAHTILNIVNELPIFGNSAFAKNRTTCL